MTNRNWWILALIAALCVASLPGADARAQTASTEQVVELLDLLNASELALQMMETMVSQFTLMMPDVPPEIWEEMMARIDAGDLDVLVAPVYQKHFTEEEVLAMIDFYSQPIGQSVLSKMPLVLQESMEVGQAWGEGIAMEIIADLQARGYEVPGANEF